MKKILVALAFMGCLIGVAKADESDLVFQINRKIHYENAAVSVSTQIVLIDLSDTVNYPHANGNEMAISKVFSNFISAPGPTNISSGTIQMGVVTYVGNSTGTVEWFASYPYFTTSTTTVNFDDLVAPSYMRTNVARVVNGDGSTRYIGTNNISSGSSSYAIAGQLPTSLGGSAAPAIGDIILNINIGSGSVIRLVMDVYYAGVRQ